jgi:hypothetical protein
MQRWGKRMQGPQLAKRVAAGVCLDRPDHHGRAVMVKARKAIMPALGVDRIPLGRALN